MKPKSQRPIRKILSFSSQNLQHWKRELRKQRERKTILEARLKVINEIDEKNIAYHLAMLTSPWKNHQPPAQAMTLELAQERKKLETQLKRLKHPIRRRKTRLDEWFKQQVMLSKH